jgi:ATP/maltotriose-dependent transcriptional regulator MalT
LSNDIDKARNISEIACSRLKNIKSGTRGLKFHATIPITIQGQKAGLINLVSKETQQLDNKQLSLLSTISELIGIAIQRTRLQDAYNTNPVRRETDFDEIINRVLQPGINEMVASLQQANTLLDKKDIRNTLKIIQQSLERAEELQQQLPLMTNETKERQLNKTTDARFHYPTSPLTNRELEILMLIRKGFSNKQIAEQLFLAERTIKFHITSILSKLLAHNRTEAVNNAIQRGILSN